MKFHFILFSICTFSAAAYSQSNDIRFFNCFDCNSVFNQLSEQDSQRVRLHRKPKLPHFLDDKTILSYNMPAYKPDPRIDYKMPELTPDPSINYNMPTYSVDLRRFNYEKDFREWKRPHSFKKK